MTSAQTMLELADEIEKSDGLVMMLSPGPRQLGIRKSAMVVAALRTASERLTAGTGELEAAIEVLDFLNSIEGAGYGGMASFEIARQHIRALSVSRPDSSPTENKGE
jgi:hypothetical protein